MKITTITKRIALFTEDRDVMGENLFGIGEWKRYYPSLAKFFEPNDLARLRFFPWDEDTLNSPCPFDPKRTIRETHFAFVGAYLPDGGRRRKPFPSIAEIELFLQEGQIATEEDMCSSDLVKSRYKVRFMRDSYPLRMWYLMSIVETLLFSGTISPDRVTHHGCRLATVGECYMKLMLYCTKFLESQKGTELFLCQSEDIAEEFDIIEVDYDAMPLQITSAYSVFSGTSVEEIKR